MITPRFGSNQSLRNHSKYSRLPYLHTAPLVAVGLPGPSPVHSYFQIYTLQLCTMSILRLYAQVIGLALADFGGQYLCGRFIFPFNISCHCFSQASVPSLIY